METSKILLSHKEIINKIRDKEKHNLSSHTFQSLYLWQEQMGLSLFLKENFFTVKADVFGDNAWFFPCGDKEEKINFIEDKLNEKDFSLIYLREKDIDFLEENFKDKFTFKRDENSDEYISDIEKYISLEGSKFAEVRRNIRKINREYDVSFKDLNEDTLGDALKVIKKWEEKMHNTDEHNITDDDVPELALSHMKELDITGIIMYLDNVPTSFFAGFPIDSDTIDIVIGKAVFKSPRATIYYALKEYLETKKDEYIYCNHEEDLGILSIRRVKESLCPTAKNILWEADIK